MKVGGGWQGGGAGRQAGWGFGGHREQVGAFQLWAEMKCPGRLSLLLLLQLPLPLMELMENEALEILTKALRSELPANPQELPRQIPVDFAGLGPKGWGFRVPYVLSDALGTHKYSKGPIKVKS